MAKTIDELKAAAAVVRDATEEHENTALRIGQLLLDTIETLGDVHANAIKGFVAIASTDDLPESPTAEQQQKGWLLGTVLYVYVGEGGDTLGGKWQSADLKGGKGDKGDSGVHLGDVVLVNDLTTGGEESALTAEMGKVINSIIRTDLLIDGENLFNGTVKTGAPWPGFVSQKYIDILTEASTKYSVNLGVSETPQYRFVAFFDDQDTYLSNTTIAYSDGKMNFITPANCAKARITVSNISSFENCYIVKGDDPNTFVPSKYLMLYEQRKEADARYAEITSLLGTKISAEKCLNKTYFSQKKYGAPWSGYASCYYYDIPRKLFNDVMFFWETAGTSLYDNFIIRLIDNNGTLSDSGFSKLKVYLQYNILRVQITADNIKTIRLVMYNWSDAQINNLFIGSDKDADYTSWNWVKLRTVPPVSGEPYYGVNEDLTKIVGTPSSDDVVFKKISSVNLLNVEDHVITGAATASPYNPVYWSNYIAVDAETLYTLSIDGMVSNYGFTTRFYDSNKTLLGSTNNNRHTTPANCAFVRIDLTNYSSVGSVDGTEHWQYQKGEVTAYESYYQYVNNDINTALSGKRFAVIGDSFTAGGAWFSRMCAKLGAFNKYNAAQSGARWSDTAEPACAYEQAQSIVASGISMDYVLCVLGVNDFSNNIPLGAVVYSDDISSMNLSTITGGIQACVAYLRNNMPNAVIKIGYTPAGQFYNLSYPDLSSIIERMKEIALLYGIDYIETRCLGASRFISSQSDCWENGTAGGHPVGQGHNIIGDGMARLILSNM